MTASATTTPAWRAILAAHRRHDGVLTMGLFHAPVPTAAGIVQMEADGRIVSGAMVLLIFAGLGFLI